MRLLLSLFAVSFAQLSSFINWNTYESTIYLNYNGGAKNMVVGLLKDYGYPANFTSLFDTATDDTIMGTIAGFTTATRNSLESELIADNGLFTFYAGILSSMTATTISRDELKVAVYDTFLLETLTASTSDLSIMTTIVEAYFDETVLAAQNYYDTSVDQNATYLNLQTIIPLLKNVKNAIKEYNSDIGLSISTGDQLINIWESAQPVIRNSLNIWENSVDQFGEVWPMVYDQVMDFMNNVVFGPIADICDRKYGPFEAVRQMVVRTAYITYTMDYFFSFEKETEELTSEIFFGERGHMLFDIKAFVDFYIFQYFSEWMPLGGAIEGELHIWSMMFDSLIEEQVYGLVKTPVCGIE